MSALVAPGFHGKLPCVGDFVRRRLPDAFVEPWDQAMQRLLIARPEHAAAGFDDDQGDARCWRFALAPGVCGVNAFAGAVIASRDRVGRGFPLAVAWPIMNADTAWFDGAQALLRRAVAGVFSEVEGFERECAALARDARVDPLFAAWRAGHDGGRACLWWTPMSEAGPGAWLLSEGLDLLAYSDGPARVSAPSSGWRAFEFEETIAP